MQTRDGQMLTDRPERFARQLASHWASKTQQSEAGGVTTLVFESGQTVELRPEQGVLQITVTVADDADVDRFAQVVTEHLQRFGQRSALVVDWG